MRPPSGMRCLRMFRFIMELEIYQSIFGLDVIPEYQHHGLASRLMRHMIEETKKRGKQGLILTCKDRLIGFYETFGYRNLGVSESVHGGAVWYDMILELEA